MFRSNCPLSDWLSIIWLNTSTFIYCLHKICTELNGIFHLVKCWFFYLSFANDLFMQLPLIAKSASKQYDYRRSTLNANFPWKSKQKIYFFLVKPSPILRNSESLFQEAKTQSQIALFYSAVMICFIKNQDPSNII